MCRTVNIQQSECVLAVDIDDRACIVYTRLEVSSTDPVRLTASSCFHEVHTLTHNPASPGVRN